ELRQVGLPGARGQHHHPLAPGREPGRQRRPLMRVRGHLQGRHEGERRERRGLVHEPRALGLERLEEAPRLQRWEAKALHPVVPGSIVEPRLPRRWGVQQQGATVEGECGWASHAMYSAGTVALVLIVMA